MARGRDNPGCVRGQLMNGSEKKLNWEEAIVPGLALLFAAAYFLQTRDAAIEVLRWPLAIAAVAGVLLLFVLFFFLFAAQGEDRARINLKKPLLILIGPLVYVFSLAYLGFALSSFLFLTTLFKCLGGRSWIRNVLVALIITGGLYVITIIVMEMSLPG